MKRSLFGPPDQFSLSPLLSLLPVVGSISGLAPLSSSLFARHEKVLALRNEMVDEPDKTAFRRLSAEEAMLKQVLDWLAQNPEETP